MRRNVNWLLEKKISHHILKIIKWDTHALKIKYTNHVHFSIRN